MTENDEAEDEFDKSLVSHASNSFDDVNSDFQESKGKKSGKKKNKLRSDKTNNASVLVPKSSSTPKIGKTPDEVRCTLSDIMKTSKQDAYTPRRQIADSNLITTVAQVSPRRPGTVPKTHSDVTEDDFLEKDCALIMTASQTPTAQQRETLSTLARTKFGVNDAAFWCDTVSCPGLTDNHLPYLLKQYADMASDDSFASLHKSLLSEADLKKRVKEFNLTVAANSALSKGIIQQIREGILSSIPQEQLSTAGELVMIRDTLNTAVIFRLGPAIDPQGKLRLRYFKQTKSELELFKWPFGMTIDNNDVDDTDVEGMQVSDWIVRNTSGNFVLSEIPDSSDKVFSHSKQNCCQSRLRSLSQKDAGSDHCRITYVAAVNAEFVDVEKFVVKSISQIACESSGSSKHYAVIDLGPYKDVTWCNSAISLGVSDSPLDVDVLTWKNPEVSSVSLVVLRFSPRQTACKRGNIHIQIPGSSLEDDIIEESSEATTRTRRERQSGPSKAKKRRQ